MKIITTKPNLLGALNRITGALAKKSTIPVLSNVLLEAKGPVRVSDVENAQREILAVARRMADAGEISLGGSSEAMI